MKRKNPFKVLRCLGLDALCERVAKSGNASIAAMMAWVVVVAAFGAYAGETTAEEARTAAGNWLQKNRNPMGTVLSAQPRESRTVRNARGGALFHLVELEGGGFIVASGNTKISPIVCFSGEGRIEEIEGGPLLDLLKGDMESQLPGGGVPNGALAAQRGMGDAEREWAELLAVDGGMRTLRSISSESSISDVRVSPLVKSKWDQSVWPSGQPVFNAQTPNGAVCGCVATAGAQIMRFWQYPSAPARTGWCSCSFNGQSIGVKINPEAYAWSQMPLTSADAYNLSSAQINAISRLTLEVGASVGMGYTTTSSGSSANTFNLSYAFTNIFGYASSKVFAPSARLTYPTVLSGDWQNAVLASLDAAMPVSASLKSSAGGHSVVIDGYGEDSGSVYLHFNMGWSGSYDIWYKVMSEKMSDYAFSQIAGFNYNIHKSTKGDVLSGRVITASGTPVSGATVTLEPSSGSKRTTTSNARGIWYFRIERAGTNYVSATKATMASDRSRIIMNKLGNDTVTVGNRWGVVLMVEEPPLEPVENPTFSPRTGGFSGSSVSVSISCATAGAQIRYTTNGAEPTESSALYSGAIAVSSSTTIRARAYKSGMKPSEVVEKHYEQNVFKGSSMLADAADSPSLSFSGNRVGCVIGQTATTYDGVDAILLKSYVESKGFMKFRRTPVLTLMVSGPGVLRFKSKSISGAFVGLPTVVCRVDGVEKVYEENGEWAAHVVAVTSYGSHSIVWEASNLQMYADSASESVSLIAIDEVEWEPGMVTRNPPRSSCT